MDRIQPLRQRTLDCAISRHEFLYLFYKHYDEMTIENEYERYGDSFYYALSTLTPNIAPQELIVGKMENNMTKGQQKEWDEKYCQIAKDQTLKTGIGQNSHMAIDYELLLSKGVNGVLSSIDRYLENSEQEKRDFYQCAKKCLLAVIEHSTNYAKEAERLAYSKTDSVQKEELLEIARVCRKVPACPAESFYEAVQSVHFMTYCISLDPFHMGHQQFQLGRPDRYLYPYYKNDIEKGVLTKERAKLLLDCLGVQINMRVPSGLSSGYMVGGRDENGKVVANELTIMLMQVVDDIRLVYPSVGLCYTSDMPDEYLNKACEILSRGRSHPAIFNDDVIAKGLIHYGVSEKESHNYIHSTCVEITPVASSNVWVASPYSNMVQLLLDTMDREYDSFDSHVSVIFQKLDERIKNNFLVENERRRVRKENSMFPLLSCFVNDCLARGVDIEKGGARYNWIMPSFVGVANLVDSLYVLKKVVYEEKAFTNRQLKQILDDDFKNNEALRQHLLNDYPKYGNDIDDVDQYFTMITEHIATECKKYCGLHSNGNLIPSVFCWEMHVRLGKETGASPDGRKAKFPLGDGSGACQGREKNGPTASILSSTKWAHHEFIGGVAVNMKFSKALLGANSLDVMKALIKTYIDRGGFEMQINVTDKKILEQAIKNPEAYRDLVVRIGGYSDYFTRLSPEMQAEVIHRTEHII